MHLNLFHQHLFRHPLPLPLLREGSKICQMNATADHMGCRVQDNDISSEFHGNAIDYKAQ